MNQTNNLAWCLGYVWNNNTNLQNMTLSRAFLINPTYPYCKLDIEVLQENIRVTSQKAGFYYGCTFTVYGNDSTNVGLNAQTIQTNIYAAYPELFCYESIEGNPFPSDVQTVFTQPIADNSLDDKNRYNGIPVVLTMARFLILLRQNINL